MTDIIEACLHGSLTVWKSTYIEGYISGGISVWKAKLKKKVICIAG